MTILELREKRNTAWNAAKAFLDSHRTEKGTLTAEDDATYSRMEQEIADLGKEIARLERQEALESELNKPVNKPLTSKPGNSATDKPTKTGRASDEYKNGMLQALRTNFRQVSNILQEGVDADGGYLVPEEYDSRLIDVLTEENIMRSLGHTITTSGEHKINIAATKPAAAWIEEGGALQFSDATFSQILLDAHKLHVAIKVTEELLYDNAFGLENYIIDQFGKGKTEDGSSFEIEDLEIFENVAYIMAYHADHSIPATIEEWLDEFEMFSIYEVLPEILELWGMNLQTEIESKKNFIAVAGK